jgi:PAS domain S-box-containing protein
MAIIGPADILKGSILIVDDQEANVSLLEQMLLGAGYVSITSTRNPYEVCELHRNNRYDLILLDLQMPGMDGFQVMEGLTKIEESGYLPVLVITAQPSHKLRALKAGAKDFISKPFELAEVLARVRNMLEVRLLHQNGTILNLARLENSQRIAQIGDWELDLAKNRLVWSEEVYRILGISRKEFPPSADTLGRLVHPDDRTFVQQENKEASEGARRVDFEHRIVRPDGHLRHFRQIAETTFDDQGRRVRVSGTVQDVTERWLADAALRDSERRFRQLVQDLPVAIYTCDARGQITLYNEAAAKLWGLRPEAGRDLWCGSCRILNLNGSLVAPEKSPMAEAILEGRSVRGREIIIERSDGSRSFVLPYSDPVRDDLGSVVGGVNILVDLTEPKRAIAQVFESEQWLKAIFEQAAVGVAQTDAATGRFLRVNQRFCDITGYTQKEMLKLSCSELTHEQDVVGDMAEIEALRDGSIREFTRETRYLSKDGSIVWVSLAMSSIGTPEGVPASFISVVQDITERKQAEREIQRQAAFAHFNPNPVLELSATGEVTYYNNAAHEMARSLGAEHPGRILPANISEIARDCLATAKTIRLETLINGRTTAWLFFPVAFNRVVHCTAGDITEQKRIEEHFLQAQKMEALGQFSGGVAHDFNNILMAISGYTQLAQMKLIENPAVREHLNAVLQAANRAADLVRQILTFSRQQPQVRRSTRLQPIVAESLKLLRVTIPATIVFEELIADDVPPVLADPTQIHQILMNLGTNAWHAMKGKGGRLSVKLEKHIVDAEQAAEQPRLRTGIYARISVGDTGCGMEQTTLRRIFEPFFTTKPPGEGTGLGLAAVHGIMDNHEGAITVSSQPGEGSLFQLYFPAHASEPTAAVIEDGSTPCGHGERILVIDDEEPLAELCRKVLTALGYEVEQETNPVAAVAKVRADPQRFKLVITDQTMPLMSGLLVSGELQRICPGLPVILMTGYTASLSAERLATAGVRGLVLKPTSIHALGTAVHAALSAMNPRLPWPESYS